MVAINYWTFIVPSSIIKRIEEKVSKQSGYFLIKKYLSYS
jgi:hypothetical protein